MVVRTPPPELSRHRRPPARVAVVTLDHAVDASEERDAQGEHATEGRSRLIPALRQVDPPLVVREFDDLYRDAPGLAEFAPRLLFLDIGALHGGHGGSGQLRGGFFGQILGAVRILRSLLPDLECVVVHDDTLDPDEHVAWAEQEIALLGWPHTASELQHAVTQALTGSVEAEGYLQFVQGICDEINNPLMFATGHLQLLASRLDAERDEETLVQVAAVRQGLTRIQATMRKVGVMGRATRVQRHDRAFGMGDLIDATAKQATAADLEATLSCPDHCRSTQLRGDLDILSGALFGLCEVGRELTPDSRSVELEVTEATGSVEMRMSIENPRLEEWELPRAFEPYHLNTILRGSPAGLNLFLLRLVARAHGWEAFVRRTGDSVEFCISAPRSRNGSEAARTRDGAHE